MRALVAMSGGVDSSVAAALMLDSGYDVVGVTLKQWQGPDGEMPTAGCCTVGDAEDARRVSAQLGIPYYVLDYVDEFRKAVVEPFGRSYLSGQTPNPCVECNRKVRFHALLERANDLDCDVLATGHHARVVRSGAGYELRRGRDLLKDQSYVLHMLGQEELARVQMPVGEITKAAVREYAVKAGLRTATKPDSQDICFVGNGDYRDFIGRHFPETARPGPIVDATGSVVGYHDGTAGFTIGQRKGLGVAAESARYVIGIDAPSRSVVIGTKDDLDATSFRAGDVSWVSGSAPPPGADVTVKVRYRSEPVAATLFGGDDGVWEVTLVEPQAAPAPGQAAVFYSDDVVLGGGTILASDPVFDLASNGSDVAS